MLSGGDWAKSVPGPIEGRIAVVGACASGKTVLVRALRALGYDARCCAQEHSYVPDMWQRVSRPEVLVYLQVSLGIVRRRRAIDYDQEYEAEQDRRLAHARRYCHILVDTDWLTREEVLARVLKGLDRHGIQPTPAREP